MLKFFAAFTKFALYFSFITTTIILLCFLFFSHNLTVMKPLEYNLGPSVSVYTENEDNQSSGSGVVFVNGNKTFVWTCRHVISDAITEAITINVREKVTKAEFKLEKVKVIGHIQNNELEEIGEVFVWAKIIRYSYADDLALLELPENKVFQYGAHFPTDEKFTPEFGAKLFHIGSMGGLHGHHSWVEGNQGQHGVAFPKCRLDRISMDIQPGSSGGGIFEFWNGRCVGLVSRSHSAKAFNQCYIVPVRNMYGFANRLDCTWALNDSIEIPDNYLDKLSDDSITIPAHILEKLQIAN